MRFKPRVKISTFVSDRSTFLFAQSLFCFYFNNKSIVYTWWKIKSIVGRKFDYKILRESIFSTILFLSQTVCWHAALKCITPGIDFNPLNAEIKKWHAMLNLSGYNDLQIKILRTPNFSLICVLSVLRTWRRSYKKQTFIKLFYTV